MLSVDEKPSIQALQRPSGYVETDSGAVVRSAIEVFVAKTNEHPKPFHWRKRQIKGSQLRNTIVNLCN